MDILLKILKLDVAIGLYQVWHGFGNFSHYFPWGKIPCYQAIWEILMVSKKKLAYSDALILKTYYLATAKKFNNNNINNYQSCIVKIYKSWFDPIL